MRFFFFIMEASEPLLEVPITAGPLWRYGFFLEYDIEHIVIERRFIDTINTKTNLNKFW